MAWVRRFVRYHSMCHPDELGSEEVNAFLTYLAVERRASAATESQARAALLFFLRRRAEFSGEGSAGRRRIRFECRRDCARVRGEGPQRSNPQSSKTAV